MKTFDSIKKFFQIEHFKKTLIVVSVILAGVLIFLAGVFTGLEKARFSYHWGEHYYENFVGRRLGPPPPFGDPERDFMNAHGAMGEVMKIDGNNLVIKNLDNTEINVSTDKQTIIRSRSQELKITDLKTGDQIIVIGAPNDQGQISAKFIRVPAGTFPN